ncbi:MAG TPA: MlaD family protein [Baekduia sp.]|nr:MlaD family protein [Baekduia sp.]
MSRVLVALGLVVVAVAAAVVLAGGADDDRVRVRAEFHDAAGLRPGSVVRINGATVGSVDELRVTGRDTAEAVLDLEHDARPGAGARAAVRPLNLLGEKFVDLRIGDRARPVRRIGLPATSTPVELDDVLDVLDPQTRDRLALLLGEAGVALGGRGKDLRAALRALPPTLEDATGLLTGLSQDTAVLERLLVEADRVADRVARERVPLGELVRTGARALEAPAARRRELQATLSATPPALAQLRATLRRLDRAGAPLRPAARGLRDTAPALTRTLQAVPGFREAAAPALRAARDTAPALTRLGREASPVVHRLRPAAASLSALAQDADALTRTLDEGAAADLLGLMQNWALAIQTRDGVGHLFRVSLSLMPDALRQLDAYVDGPARRRGRARPQPAARPDRGVAVPSTPSRPRDPVERAVPGPLRPALEQVQDAIRGLTGAGKAGGAPQERTLTGVLDFLLRP